MYLRNVASFFVFSLLFVLPFVIAPFGVTQFENPKVIIAEAGIILLFLLSLFCNQISFRKRTIQLLLYGVIIALTVIHMLFFKTDISFFGNAFRMQGMFLLWLLLLFSYVSANISLKKIPWYVFAFLIFAECIITVFLPLNASGRIVGTLGEPNALASFMLFLWPFLWFSIKKDRWWKILCLSLAFIAIIVIFFLTKSRSALIGFGIQWIFLLLYRLHFSIKKSVIICLLLLLASFLLPFFENNVLYENRGEVWTAGYYAGVSHPLLGGGFGNTELLLHTAAQVHKLRIRFYYVDSAHNIFLDWWVQGGIVGLTILCLLLFFSLKKFISYEESRNIVLFLGLLTALSFNPASVIGLLQFWWLVGKGDTTK